MKKSIIPFMAGLLLPFACTQIEELSIVPEDGSGNILIISASSSSVTKTALDADNSVSFLETDALSVFCQIEENSYSNNKFTVKELYDDGSADFQGSVTSAEGKLPVMYPYQEEAKFEKYNKTYKLYFTVPAEQNAVPGTFDPDAAISLGMAEVDKTGEGGKASVSLSNACALVKFAVPLGNYSKVELSASGCEICGPCSANAMGTIGDIAVTTGGESTVTLTGDIEGGNTYYLAVVPGKATGGIIVKLYDTLSTIAGEKSTSNPVEFKKGCILNIGVLPTSTPTWTGSGTKSDPYIISTSEHLRLLAQAFSLRETATPYAGKHFLQTADIDMGGEAITIGNYKDRYRDTDPAWGVPTYFNAVYDGGGYTISNYKLKFITNKDCQYNAGLFNCVRDATIKNLKVRPAVSVAGNLIDGITDIDGYYHIGMLVGYLSGNTTISGCTSLAKSGGGSYIVECTEETSFLGTPLTVNVGGLVGYISAKLDAVVNISNCTNEANVILNKGSNMDVVGGLIGTDYYDSFTINIDRCRNKGNVVATSNKAEVYAGGIFGRITDGPGGDILVHFSNCVNEGSIEAKTQASEDACAGGIAGSNNSDGWGFMQFSDRDPWVFNCLNKGNIYAKGGDDVWAGGIFGYCYDSNTKLALCVNTGSISAESGDDLKIGPICGTGGDHWWCFWLESDSFKNYTPEDNYHCHSCKSGINAGDVSTPDTPEYVRLHGKANDGETGDNLFTKTGWSQFQWNAAASWTGFSNPYWGTLEYKNTLDLI